jgi:DNA-binding transcriptional LysR family regulator
LLERKVWTEHHRIPPHPEAFRLVLVSSRHADRVEELRLQDLTTFTNVYRTGSITAAARELGVTPSQVSKAIARLERATRRRLFTRGARGIGLTSAGRQILPRVEQMVSLARLLDREEKAPDGELTIAAPSSLLPPILPSVVAALPGIRVRGIELPPALLRGYAAEEIFDVALLPGRMAGRPAKWAHLRIGDLRKSLLASPAVASKLGLRPTVEQVRAAPFVGPVAYDGGKFVASTDDCPLSLSERTIASEVGTMGLALRLAAECDYLVFGPVIAAQRELKDGSLVELSVRGWQVSETLFLACDAERVLARVQTAIVQAVRSALADVPVPRLGRARYGS